MTAALHTCGDAALDPSACEGCRVETIPSGSAMRKAEVAIARSDAGLCQQCDRPADTSGDVQGGLCRFCWDEERGA